MIVLLELEKYFIFYILHNIQCNVISFPFYTIENPFPTATEGNVQLYYFKYLIATPTLSFHIFLRQMVCQSNFLNQKNKHLLFYCQSEEQWFGLVPFLKKQKLMVGDLYICFTAVDLKLDYLISICSMMNACFLYD